MVIILFEDKCDDVYKGFSIILGPQKIVNIALIIMTESPVLPYLEQNMGTSFS